jgi:probable rRNA maturation factor
MTFKILLGTDPALKGLPEHCRRALESQARTILERIEAPGIAPVVSILACSDGTIRRLNRRWLGRDRLTNVISFQSPQMSAAARRHGPVPLRRGALGRHFGENKGEKIFLGDIAVGIERSSAEAARAGMEARDRLAELVFHGLMHILGYTHGTMPKMPRATVHRRGHP